MGPKSSNLKFKHLLLYSCSARALCATVLIKIQFSILLHIRGVTGYLKLDGQVVMRRATGGAFYSAKNWMGNCPPCPPATYAPVYNKGSNFSHACEV